VSLGKRKVLIFKPSRLLRQKLNKTR
jgi:hypothetical protein